MSSDRCRLRVDVRMVAKENGTSRCGVSGDSIPRCVSTPSRFYSEYRVTVPERYVERGSIARSLGAAP